MTTVKTILTFLIIIFYGCGRRSPDPSNKSTQILSQKDSISDKEIYDFMQIVIADQELQKENGLTFEPQSNCDLLLDDEEFLKSLLIDTIKHEVPSDTSGWRNGTFTATIELLDKCLTNADIDFMLQQKIDHSNFRWDNSRLDFNMNNNNNWYIFSIPLFSKDKTKAIMMIRDLCRGLCGGGWTVLFKKENNKWVSQRGNQWLH